MIQKAEALEILKTLEIEHGQHFIIHNTWYTYDVMMSNFIKCDVNGSFTSDNVLYNTCAEYKLK